MLYRQVEEVGIITPYSAQVRLLQDVVGSSRRSSVASSTAASGPPALSPSDGNGGSEGAGNGSGDGDFCTDGGSGQELPVKGGERRGTVMPEIASVDGYQGREKEVRKLRVACVA